MPPADAVRSALQAQRASADASYGTDSYGSISLALQEHAAQMATSEHGVRAAAAAARSDSLRTSLARLEALSRSAIAHQAAAADSLSEALQGDGSWEGGHDGRGSDTGGGEGVSRSRGKYAQVIAARAALRDQDRSLPAVEEGEEGGGHDAQPRPGR